MCKLRNVKLEFYLSDWHPADGGIQDSRVGIGAHFRHKTKPLSPANTVLLNLLSVGKKKTQGENKSPEIYFKMLNSPFLSLYNFFSTCYILRLWQVLWPIISSVSQSQRVRFIRTCWVIAAEFESVRIFWGARGGKKEGFFSQ